MGKAVISFQQLHLLEGCICPAQIALRVLDAFTLAEAQTAFNNAYRERKKH